MSQLSPATSEWFFADGLFGFPAGHHFRFEHAPDLGPVAQMLCLDEPKLSFFVADPRVWYDTYSVDVPLFDLEQLGAGDPAQLAVYAILNVEAEPFKVTVNLLGPLVVNPVTGQARQIIQTSRPYSAQQPMTDEVEHARP